VYPILKPDRLGFSRGKTSDRVPECAAAGGAARPFARHLRTVFSCPEPTSRDLATKKQRQRKTVDDVNSLVAGGNQRKRGLGMEASGAVSGGERLVALCTQPRLQLPSFLQILLLMQLEIY